MPGDPHPLPPTSRWLALGAAAGAALALALERFGLSGPWTSVALLLVLLALFAITAYLHASRRRDDAWKRADERVRRGEAAIGELQREIDRHTQLEQQLLQAKQAAESAVMAKGEFLATMSHEIRTPLNGIVPMLDLLLHAGSLAPDHRELVRTAYASSHQLLRIVDDILDYSKLEADRLVTSRTEQQAGKPAKKIYAITELGRREFINSLFEQLGEDEYRSEFLLFARFAHELPRSLVQLRLTERLASLDQAIAEMDRLATNHTSPADRWIIDYGRSCMAFARDHIEAHMGELIALGRPEAAAAAE